MTNSDIHSVDWTKIPPPVDDGAADHLTGMRLPNIKLPSTNGDIIDVGYLEGVTVLFAYPRTGTTQSIGLVDDWCMIPGARGCTPQTCAFRDLAQDFMAIGVNNLFGLSTQNSLYQKEMVERLHVPFPILSDTGLELAHALRLPVFQVSGHSMFKRLTLVARDGVIEKVFYPIFPPDQNASNVLEWLKKQ